MLKPKNILLSCLFAACASSIATAHGGKLNSSGCHNDRKAGTYHCHGGGSAHSEPSYDSSSYNQPKTSPSRKGSSSSSTSKQSHPQKSQVKQQPIKACSNADEVNVRESSDTISTVIHQLNRNNCVLVYTRPFSVSENSYSWVYVQLSDGRYGYVVSSFLNL